MKETLKNRIGFSFQGIIVLMGFAAMLCSIPIIFQNLIFGLILLVIGAFLGISSYGSQIDVRNNRFREYGSVFGIKTGKWHNLNSMPFLGVFKSRSGYRVYSRTLNSTTDIDDSYEVSLMNNSHRRRIVIQKFKTKEEALDYVQLLEKKIDVKLTAFNPTISEKRINR